MKIKFSYKDIHSCEAVVLSCIDFRFWRETVEFVEHELGIKTCDFPSIPGSAKTISELAEGVNLAMACIGVPINLHHAKKVVIVNHEDCGAYGGSANFKGDSKAEQAFHEQELFNARNKLVETYPDKEYILVYAKLTDNKENIEFVIVD